MMKNLMKRSLSVLLAVCMIFVLTLALAPACKTHAAAKKITLSGKSVSMKTGKTRKLTVKNAKQKVRWSSTKKKVAYVKKTSGKRRQYALIKAEKAGTCYIRAKVGRKTLRCKVKVTKASAGRVIRFRDYSGTSRDLAAGLSVAAPGAVTPTADFNALVSDFSFNLLRKTIELDPEAQTGNSLISPDSVLTALAMVENGAAGSTLTEMMNVFAPGMTLDDFNANLSSMNNRLVGMGKPVYTVANSIWAKQGEIAVKKSFLEANKAYYNAAFYEAPFNDDTVHDMNAWVYNNTRNMIDGIVDQLDPQLRMVLMNAIAFEGNWADEFDEQFTKNEDFTKADGMKQTVAMMNQTDYYSYLELKGGIGFGKPYVQKGNDNIAFVGLLPPEGTSVDAYLAAITGSDFISAWKNRKNEKLAIKLPKFTYDYKTSMKNSLYGMGMKAAFTDDCDLSGMIDMANSPTKSLKIDDVLHKAHIELDEKGTKAAAVTAVFAEYGAAPSQTEPIPVYLNRPFIYALADVQTGIPLFVGVVRNIPVNQN